MKVRDCPRCGGPMGIAKSYASQDHDESYRFVLQCGEIFGPDREWSEERLLDCEANGYPIPCGHEEPIPADIEAQMEERPRLL